MTSFLSLLPADGWPRLLCDALWQSTLIAAIGLVVAKFLVRQSAARAWLLLLTLTACMLAPLASVAARAQGFALFPATATNVAANQTVPEPPVEPGAIGTSPEMTTPELTDTHGSTSNSSDAPEELVKDEPLTIDTHYNDTSSSSDDEPALIITTRWHTKTSSSSTPSSVAPASDASWVRAALGIGWLIASSLLIGRLALSLAATWRLLRRAEPCHDSVLLAAANSAAQRIGLPKAPPLSISADVQTPTIFCLGRTRLLIPQNTPSVDWVAAFTHELAHVKRGDGWSRLWTEIVAVALPLSPLVWLARRTFHTACEEACDDWAVAAGANPVDLAETLTAWINVRQQPALLAAIGMSSTKARTLRLLALRETPITRLGRVWRWVGVPAALMLMVGLALAQSPTPGSKTDRSAKPSEAKGDHSLPKSETKSTSDSASQKSSPPSEEKIEKALADDALVTLYSRQLADAEKDWRDAKAEFDSHPSKDSEKQLEKDEKYFRERISDSKARIAKRKAEIRPRIIEELTDAAAGDGRAQNGGTTSDHNSLGPYVIEPPDILMLDPIQLAPKKPVRIVPGDKVRIDADGTKYDQPIKSVFKVDSAGEVVLGPGYGTVKITGLTRREAEEAIEAKLKEMLVDPIVALTIDESRLQDGIVGKHLVGPDGTINLGTYGQVKVDGLTIEGATKAIRDKLATFFLNPVVAVDVFGYNSKVYYVIVKGDKGDTIQRFPITGNETVLDALSQLKGVGGYSQAKIWISRTVGGDRKEKVIHVDWNEALQGNTPQILPGDRIFIEGSTAANEVGILSGYDHGTPVFTRVPPTSAQSQITVDGVPINWKLKPATEPLSPYRGTPLPRRQSNEEYFGQPVVVKTVPEAGTKDVDPSLSEISVTFSREMQDSWSWVQTSDDSYPKTTGEPHYTADKRTCVLPVKLEPGKTYSIWINDEKYGSFMGADGDSAAPYLLVFKTKDAGPGIK